jgi:two-component system sensor kinase FixL
VSDIMNQLSAIRVPGRNLNLANTAVGMRRGATAAVLLSLAIFAVDTLTSLGSAIAVLYSLVVVLSASFLNRQGTLIVAALCVFLTITSFFFVHDGEFTLESNLRCVVSLSAICLATVMALRNQSAMAGLKDQAELLDCSHDAIIACTLDGVITYWNQSSEALYGFEASVAKGKKVSDLLKTQYSVPLETILSEMLSVGKWEGELIHTRRDGTPVVVASRWSCQMDERGKPKAIMETNNDVTDRRRDQEALLQTQAALSHATRVSTLGELTASIAHEVNQPLAAVVTNGEACLRWLNREVPNIPVAVASVEKMISNGRRASNVIARLRALAKNSTPEHSDLDANDLVEDVLVLVQQELSSRNVHLQLALAPTPLPISGDLIQLQQVLINLVMNGVQAMEHTPADLRALTISTAKLISDAGDQTIISVRDFGPGISEDDAAKVFGAFFSTKSTGLGMGLSICRSIVQAHDGKIAFTSADGPGVVFSVQLPSLGHGG